MLNHRTLSTVAPGVTHPKSALPSFFPLRACVTLSAQCQKIVSESPEALLQTCAQHGTNFPTGPKYMFEGPFPSLRSLYVYTNLDVGVHLRWWKHVLHNLSAGECTSVTNGGACPKTRPQSRTSAN